MRQRKHSGETYAKCVEAATKLFATRGLEGTSMRDISLAVGITSSAVLHHFGTKENIYIGVFKALSLSFSESLLAEEPQIGVMGVIVFFNRYFTWAIRHPYYAQLITRELIENRHVSLIRDTADMHGPVVEAIETIRRCQENGSIIDCDAKMFTISVLGMITQFAASTHTVGRHFDEEHVGLLERFHVHLTDLLVAMLSPGFDRGELPDMAPVIRSSASLSEIGPLR